MLQNIPETMRCFDLINRSLNNVCQKMENTVKTCFSFPFESCLVLLWVFMNQFFFRRSDASIKFFSAKFWCSVEAFNYVIFIFNIIFEATRYSFGQAYDNVLVFPRIRRPKQNSKVTSINLRYSVYFRKPDFIIWCENRLLRICVVFKSVKLPTYVLLWKYFHFDLNFF